MAAGKRTGGRPKRQFRPDLLLLAAGITFAVVAWGYLVLAAIDFGAKARHEGEAAAWLLLLVAAVGAMGCLFLGLMLVARFSRAIGLTEGAEPKPKRDRNAPKGGKRAAR